MTGKCFPHFGQMICLFSGSYCIGVAVVLVCPVQPQSTGVFVVDPLCSLPSLVFIVVSPVGSFTMISSLFMYLIVYLSFWCNCIVYYICILLYKGYGQAYESKTTSYSMIIKPDF